MSTEAKMHHDPAIGDKQATAVYDEAVALFLHGVERMADAQKQFVDIAVQHNSEMIGTLKKAVEKLPSTWPLDMLDVTCGAVSRCADVQKAGIDFLVQQSRAWTDVLQDRGTTVRKTTEASINAAKQALECSFAVQKKALEHTAAQTKAFVDAGKQHFGTTGPEVDVLADTFQRGVDTLVDAQKEFLELVTH